jgi:hypothetical protein
MYILVLGVIGNKPKENEFYIFSNMMEVDN